MSHRDVVCRLAVATSSELPAFQPDDLELATALQELGVAPTVCIWSDPTIDWSAFDAVLIRTVWDYYKHHAAFLDWLDRLDQLGIATINDSQLLRWNSDKRYLLALAEHGVGIIPTRLASWSGLPALLATMPGQEVVIKPTVSGSAWHTVRGTIGDDALATAVAQLPPQHDYLVQPFVPEIVSDGEWSLLFFGGRFSHAVIKRAARGDFRVQGEFGGSVTPMQPDAATLDAATRALAAISAAGHKPPTYVRVDGVICAGRFLIMELEMIEPFLFLGTSQQGSASLARAVRQRVAASPAALS